MSAVVGRAASTSRGLRCTRPCRAAAPERQRSSAGATQLVWGFGPRVGRTRARKTAPALTWRITAAARSSPAVATSARPAISCSMRGRAGALAVQCKAIQRRAIQEERDKVCTFWFVQADYVRHAKLIVSLPEFREMRKIEGALVRKSKRCLPSSRP